MYTGVSFLTGARLFWMQQVG